MWASYTVRFLVMIYVITLAGSYLHFTQPKVAFSALNDIRLNSKVMINAGLSAPVSEDDKLILYTDVFTQGGSRQVQGGLL